VKTVGELPQIVNTASDAGDEFLVSSLPDLSVIGGPFHATTLGALPFIQDEETAREIG